MHSNINTVKVPESEWKPAEKAAQSLLSSLGRPSDVIMVLVAIAIEEKMAQENADDSAVFIVQESESDFAMIKRGLLNVSCMQNESIFA
jgi:hypothetical protein